MSARQAELSTHTQRSVIGAPIEHVWARVASMEGINDELMPYMRMVLPRRHRGKTIADIEVGVPIGKVMILYGGMLPVDYDDLTIVDLSPGTGFREESSMASMSVWHHERRLSTAASGGTDVVDTLQFRPRLPLRPVTPVLVWFIGHLFRHRHRRLAAYFG
ncbi:hypothetical protein [Gordonia sp. OPL2]|uniref:hypothetical protein n=1 Tax=Gordonia sp. OPL2 TaxID=2486274 RepID=UPI001654E5A6|nr:hypothetical protein [Gordonia sp. OPL2]ROZ87675.1 hypothetical protein EEB19_22895 [Gordonia sp. OPL2]